MGNKNNADIYSSYPDYKISTIIIINMINN